VSFDDAHLEALAAGVGGRSALNALLAVYREDLERQVARLREAFKSGEPEAIRLAAHALRSGAATFGATHLAGAARELEALFTPAPSRPRP
jgi:HPt (histidine-containing phosphotransfer) domain-containing protein